MPATPEIKLNIESNKGSMFRYRETGEGLTCSTLSFSVRPAQKKSHANETDLNEAKSNLT
jgi:hypothetical protein